MLCAIARLQRSETYRDRLVGAKTVGALKFDVASFDSQKVIASNFGPLSFNDSFKSVSYTNLTLPTNLSV